MKYLAGELVFAFGSNLSIAQMVRRCPSVEYVARAELPGHELAFGGYSTRWGGAVATFVPARRRRVRGVIYSLTLSDLHRLDGYEGVPRMYDRLRVLVRVGRFSLPAHTYQLVGFDDFGVPSASYIGILAAAYRAWGYDRRHLIRAVRAGADAEGKIACV